MLLRAIALTALRRTHVRAVEQPINLDDGNDVDYWPFMIVGLAQAWQLTNAQAANLREYLLRAGGRGCMGDGVVPRWRGVEDDDGRLMVLIAFNNDVADGWQWADDPRYPSEVANLSLRLGVNVAMYAMTH